MHNRSVAAFAVRMHYTPMQQTDFYDWTITCQPERPYMHAYHQTLVMKIALADKRPGGGCRVVLTFAEALEVIRRLDHITCGIPKIIYLVGWQYNGHDSNYPAWDKVNERLQRPCDATATDSLKWLMAEAFKYNTTVSLHVCMIDASEESSLWQTYLDHDIIAKDKKGNPLKGEVFGGWIGTDTQSYQISYAREWETGYTQKRIDGLLDMLPIRRAATIHIDAFHSMAPGRDDQDTISPYLGYPIGREIQTQRMIFRYFRDRGVDVTAEGGSYWLRRDPFVGLQPMAWHFHGIDGCPVHLYCGTPMHAEGDIRNDPDFLNGLIGQFCLKVVPWYYANNSTREKAGNPINASETIFMPALWAERAVVAYSRKGASRADWKLPPGWDEVKQVRLQEISVNGLSDIGTEIVTAGRLAMDMPPMLATWITPLS